MPDRPVPKCPGCGKDMELQESTVVNYWYSCDCGWSSPLEDTPERAYAAAMQRAEPPRTPIEISDVTWLGVPYFAEYKGVDELFVYVTGNGMEADFEAAHELGWEGETLGEFWRWEKEHGKLQVRLWEARHSPPTDEERAAPWKEAEQ